MNLLFLSTDGILTNQNYISMIYNRGPNYVWNHQNQIDKSKINFLNYLVSKSNCQVILSGQWRLLYDLNSLNEMLQKAGARFKAIGTTPYIYQFADGRKSSPSDELEKALKTITRKVGGVDKFIILDAHTDYGAYNDHFIKVNYEKGLRHSDVEKCFDKLGIHYKKY